jgi:protein ImuA
MRSSLLSEGQGPPFEEVLAAPGHSVSATAFGLGRALEARAHLGRSGRSILWVRSDAVLRDWGSPYGLGLQALGCAPEEVLLATLARDLDVLRAGLDGARTWALGAVLMETRVAVDLTASRRLKLASETSGVPVILVRHGGAVAPNAVRLRWAVKAGPPRRASLSLERLRPQFSVELLKHPLGASDRSFVMEWDREQCAFLPDARAPAALSRAVAALSASGLAHACAA